MPQINHVHCRNWKEDDPHVIEQCEEIIRVYESPIQDEQVKQELDKLFPKGVTDVDSMAREEYSHRMFTRHVHEKSDQECRKCRKMDPKFDEVFKKLNYGKAGYHHKGRQGSTGDS